MKTYIILKKSAKTTDRDSRATLYVRIRNGRSVDITVKTRLLVNANLWDSEHEQIKTKVICDQKTRDFVNYEAREIKRFLEDRYMQQTPEVLNKEWAESAMAEYYNPQNYIEESTTPPAQIPLVDLFDEFLEKHKISEVRKKNFRVIGRSLRRYELFVRKTRKGHKDFILYANDVTSDTLQDLWDYLENEHEYYVRYPNIFKEISEKRKPMPRGKNSLLDCFTRIRTFFIWLFNNSKTTNRPFDQFHLDDCVYGTPYYITIDERNKIYRTNLSRHPKLAIQRDIFVFQCLVGCRVGDLTQLKRNNIINSALEYIPRKTKEGRVITVRVPLNATALEIVNRYCDFNPSSDKLLPFISDQKYNQAIKLVFKAAGMNRLVTVINPTTGQEEKRLLYEIASSHLARRTFVGNLYKKVKDQNLVAALSGHKEGSKAFARYREIDEEMRKELIDMLS